MKKTRGSLTLVFILMILKVASARIYFLHYGICIKTLCSKLNMTIVITHLVITIPKNSLMKLTTLFKLKIKAYERKLKLKVMSPRAFV